MTSMSVTRRQAVPETGYIDQSPADLRLFLVGGEIDPGQFTILQEAAVAWSGCSVRLGIIGESHFAQVRGPDRVLTEICACTELRPDADTTVLSDHRPRDLHEPISLRIGADGYACEASYLVGRQGVAALRAFSAEAEDLVAANPDAVHRMHLVFPREDPRRPAPQTLVVTDVASDLVIRTAHSYPSYDTIVLTRSRLTRPGPCPEGSG